MTNLKEYREKYAKRIYGRFERYPPGGEDVNRLLNIIDNLVTMLRYIQRGAKVTTQNQIESALYILLNLKD